MKMIRIALLVALVGVFNLVNVNAQGQGRPGRGNFDPAQFRERMMERVRENLDVKDDADWKLISDRVSKVMEARRELGPQGMGMGMFGRGRRGGGDNNDNAGQGGGRRGPGGFGAPSPEAEALQKAIDAKASGDEIKAKLAKYRDSRKEKEETLKKAQEDLRKVLSVRQEAEATLMGLLD